jgi:hypothetical protein
MNNDFVVDLDALLIEQTIKAEETIQQLIAQPIHIDWDHILTEWSYRLPKGYPTIVEGQFSDPQELTVLREILQEYGIDEIPTLMINESKVVKKTLQLEVSKEDLKQLIDKLPDDFSANQLQKLYNRISAFGTFKPIRKALQAKGFKSAVDKSGKVRFDMPKAIASQLQLMIEELPTEMYQDFVDYITTGDQVVFPVDQRTGNINNLLSDTGVAEEVTTTLAKYTGQDEGKKGVGMAEIMLALSFKNIRKPPGAGDLEIDDRKFEVKGFSARLGGTGPYLSKEGIAKLSELGMTLQSDAKLTYKGITARTPIILSIAGKDDPKKIKELFAYLLTQVGIPQKFATHSANLVKDWGNQYEINTAWGLGNFMTYAERDDFSAFIAADYGTSGTNKGNYVYVQGSPEEMATQLFDAEVPFEGFNFKSNTYPRIVYKKR